MRARDEMVRKLLEASSLFAQARILATTPGSDLLDVDNQLRLVVREIHQARELLNIARTSQALEPEIAQRLRDSN